MKGSVQTDFQKFREHIVRGDNYVTEINNLITNGVNPAIHELKKEIELLKSKL